MVGGRLTSILRCTHIENGKFHRCLGGYPEHHADAHRSLPVSIETNGTPPSGFRVLTVATGDVGEGR